MVGGYEQELQSHFRLHWRLKIVVGWQENQMLEQQLFWLFDELQLQLDETLVAGAEARQ